MKKSEKKTRKAKRLFPSLRTGENGRDLEKSYREIDVNKFCGEKLFS